MSIIEILAQVKAILKDEPSGVEPTVVAIQPVHDMARPKRMAKIRCYTYNELNHMVSNSWQERQRRTQTLWEVDMLISVSGSTPHHMELPKRTGGQYNNTSFLHMQDLNLALPRIRAYVNGKRCTALLHYECSNIIVMKKKKNIDMSLISGRLHICGIGTIGFGMGDRETISINALVIHKNPLGFNIKVGIDTINVQSRGVHFMVS